jgi:uncharacterized protein YaiI (UPF0178 family)
MLLLTAEDAAGERSNTIAAWQLFDSARLPLFHAEAVRAIGNGHPAIGSNMLSEPAKAIAIYVDADACPVKAEVYRVAERYAIKVYVVSNSAMAIPRTPLVERVIVGSGPDAADDWIAERVSRGAIVITADVPLAHRCIKAGADVIAPTGRVLTEASIGMALATRNLMEDLRSAGQVTGGPKPFQARDRSNFLSTLDLAIVRLKRDGFGA